MNESLAELHRQGVFLKPEKAQEWDPDGKIEVIFDRFVKSDMRLSCSQGSLPSTIMEAHDAPLNGYFVLQVLECIDISESNRNRKADPPFTAHRTLKICFTDGQTTAIGLELSPSKALSNLDAGAKVVISNSPLVFRGVILLEPRHIALLSLTKAPPKEPPTDGNNGPPPQQSSIPPQQQQQQHVPPKQESSMSNANQPNAGPNPSIPPGAGGGAQGLVKNEGAANPQPVMMHQNPGPEHGPPSSGVGNHQYHHVNPAQQQQQQSAPLHPPVSGQTVSNQNQPYCTNKVNTHAPTAGQQPRSPVNQGHGEMHVTAGVSAPHVSSSHSGMHAPQDQIHVLQNGNVQMQHAMPMPMPSAAAQIAPSVQQSGPRGPLNSTGRYDQHLHPTMNMYNSRSPSPSLSSPSLSTGAAGGQHINRPPSPNSLSPNMPHHDSKNNIRSPSPCNPLSPHAPNVNDKRSPSPRPPMSSNSHHLVAPSAVLPPAAHGSGALQGPAIHPPPWSHGQRPNGTPGGAVVHNQSAVSEPISNGPPGKMNSHDGPNGQNGGIMGRIGEYNKENSSNSVQTRPDGIMAPEHGKDVLPQSEGHMHMNVQENQKKQETHSYQAPAAESSSTNRQNALTNPYQIPAASSSSSNKQNDATNPYQIPGAFSSSTREENPYQIPAAVSSNNKAENPYRFSVNSSSRIRENPYGGGLPAAGHGDNPNIPPAHNMMAPPSTVRGSAVSKNPPCTPMVSALSNLFFAPNPLATEGQAPAPDADAVVDPNSVAAALGAPALPIPGTPLLPPTPASSASRQDICPTPPVHEDEMIEFFTDEEKHENGDDRECPTPPAHEDEVIEFFPGEEQGHENGGKKEEEKKCEQVLPGRSSEEDCEVVTRDGRGPSQKEEKGEHTNVGCIPTSASVKHALVRKVFQLGGETVILLGDGEQTYNIVVPRQFHKHAVIGTEGWFACEGNTMVGFSQSPPTEAVLKAALQF